MGGGANGKLARVPKKTFSFLTEFVGLSLRILMCDYTEEVIAPNRLLI